VINFFWPKNDHEKKEEKATTSLKGKIYIKKEAFTHGDF
jgi:hypothetical protein